MEDDQDIPIQHSGYTPLGTKPNDGADESEVRRQVPVLAKILDRYNKKIAALQDYGSIRQELKTKPDEFMHAVAGRDAAAAIIKKERDYLQKQIDKLT